MKDFYFNIPPVTRNLLLINILIYLLQQISPALTFDAALYYVQLPQFHFWQLFTYMFLHGSMGHLFFNMFGLWMFGMVIERTLGSQRFLLYYLVCGVGAALCQEAWQGLLIHGFQVPAFNSTIGASGAVYGVLLAFGMLYPNERIMLLIPPIPMKAKYFVIGFIALEVFSLSASDGIAHFAHLGGMLFGWALIHHWKRQAMQRQFGGWQKKKEKEGFINTFKRAINEAKQKVSKEDAKQHMKVVGGSQMNDLQQRKEREEREKAEKERRIGEILDKVKTSGYESLTKEEKDYLFDNCND